MGGEKKKDPRTQQQAKWSTSDDSRPQPGRAFGACSSDLCCVVSWCLLRRSTCSLSARWSCEDSFQCPSGRPTAAPDPTTGSFSNFPSSSPSSFFSLFFLSFIPISFIHLLIWSFSPHLVIFSHIRLHSSLRSTTISIRIQRPLGLKDLHWTSLMGMHIVTSWVRVRTTSARTPRSGFSGQTRPGKELLTMFVRRRRFI